MSGYHKVGEYERVGEVQVQGGSRGQYGGALSPMAGWESGSQTVSTSAHSTEVWVDHFKLGCFTRSPPPQSEYFSG